MRKFNIEPSQFVRSIPVFTSSGLARRDRIVLSETESRDLEEICSGEWLEWYRLSPLERLSESQKMWAAYLALGAPLIPNPILKVLSTIEKAQVKALLMGGQACVVYGAAEFSRDTDLVIRAEVENLERFKSALRELQAERIAVPEFKLEYLSRGHAIHFRCAHQDVAGLRIDVMSKLRGVDLFDNLWARQVTITDSEGNRISLLSLPDLVRAKKTQRAKDWPMIQRLVEVDYLKHRLRSSQEQLEFWLRELRSPELLVELCKKHVQLCERFVPLRPLLSFAQNGETASVDGQLVEEEKAERDRDRKYWEPLRKELEAMRRGRF